MSGVEHGAGLSSEPEIVTSTGTVDTIEERSFNRVYLTDGQTYTNTAELLESFNRVLTYDSTVQPVLRRVFRTFATRIVVQELLQREYGTSAPTSAGARLEMVLELEQFLPESERATEDRYLITLAQNFHPNEITDSEIARGASFVQRSWARDVRPVEAGIEHIETQGYQLSREISEADSHRLTELWGPTFGWSRTQVEKFIHTYRDNPNLWFSGVRDAQGILVAACMAEAVKIGDYWYVELTEWIAKTPGTASKMISGLIVQVLDRLGTQPGQRLPIIAAEMNLHHVNAAAVGSPGAGVSAGLVLPISHHVALGGSENILRHNVQVEAGRPVSEPMIGENIMSGAELNNFMMGVLPHVIFERYFTPATIAAVMNHYKEGE